MGSPQARLACTTKRQAPCMLAMRTDGERCQIAESNGQALTLRTAGCRCHTTLVTATPLPAIRSAVRSARRWPVASVDSMATP